MDGYTNKDVIAFATAGKPVEMTKAFAELMGQKLNDKIRDRKTDIAQAMVQATEPASDDEVSGEDNA